MTDLSPIHINLNVEQAGKRLDKVLVELFPDYSRGCLQAWLKEGYITLNGQSAAAKYKVKGDELLEFNPPELVEPDNIEPQPIELDIAYEDKDLIVINKPAGLVVHPAAGNRDGTLQNGLLYHCAELAAVPRAGIVHRLDKDTTGLLVIARNLQAHKSLVEQLQQRTVKREYSAIVQGVVVAGGIIEAAIGRHPTDRKRMTVRADGRQALTHYRVITRYRQHTHLQVHLDTGRTHQIRVHMAHIHKPLVGDPVYAGRLRIPAACTSELRQQLQYFRRQALHAIKLELQHPSSGELMQWQAALPADMQALLDALQLDQQAAMHG